MPSPGVTMRRIPEGSPAAGAAVLRLHASAYMTLAEIEGLRTKYTREADFQKEINIEYEALEGQLMYPEYKPEYVDCDPFDVSDPARWSIWMACDPHMRTPHAFGWEAFNSELMRRVCGELWPDRQFTVREYSEVIKWIESDSKSKPRGWEWAEGRKLRIIKRFMDTHGVAANSDEGIDYFEAYRKYGLHFYPALKGQQALAAARDRIGMSMIPDAVIVGDDVRLIPKRQIFRTCRETRSEYANVRYPEGEVERPGQERPKTYRKHLIDCAHYIETGNPGFVRMLSANEQNTFTPISAAVGY